MTERLSAAKALLEQAEGLALLAEEAEVCARHFKPRYQAYWDKDGRLTVDAESAMRLRYFAIERMHEAERYRREEAELRAAARLLAEGSI